MRKKTEIPKVQKGAKTKKPLIKGATMFKGVLCLRETERTYYV
jgi:hypothetical protein